MDKYKKHTLEEVYKLTLANFKMCKMLLEKEGIKKSDLDNRKQEKIEADKKAQRQLDRTMEMLGTIKKG